MDQTDTSARSHRLTSGKTIVAATDMRAKGFPILRKAAEIGQRVQRSLVAVHNVTPFEVSGADIAWMVKHPQPAVLLHAPGQRLESIAERLAIEAQTVVRSEASACDAIVSEADARGADFVVVGTRPRDFWDGLWSSSVSARVVNRASCSVLVQPLERRVAGLSDSPGVA